MSMLDAFRRADDVLLQAVRGISDLIVHTGTINVDFADVKTIMSSTGRALMGTGYGRGDDRAIQAAEIAVNSPLLDDISIQGATGILINFTGGPDIRAKEIAHAAMFVQQAAHEEANIIFGLVTDPDMGDVVKVTVIATGFDMQPGNEIATPRAKRVAIPGLSANSANIARASHVPAARTTAAGMRASNPPAPAPEPPARRSVEVAVPLSVSDRLQPRAFGAAAMNDEATLDIPAYIRRSRP